MKIKKSLITLVTIAPVITPVLLVTGCNKNNNDPVIVKDIFEVKDGVLTGLKQGVTADDIKTNIKDNTLVLPAVKTIKENAFINGSLFNALPNNTKVVVNALVIEDYAFYGSDKTTVDVELKNTITIGKSAFAQMLGLKSVAFPETIMTIGANAFLGDIALEDINVTAFRTESKASTVSIGNISAFAGTKKTGRVRGTTAEITQEAWSLFHQNGLSLEWDTTDKDGNPFPIGPLKPTPSYFFKFTTTEEEATLTGVNETYADTFDKYTVLQIPDTYDEKPVTAIADGVLCRDPGIAGVKPKFPNTTTIKFGKNLKNTGNFNFALLEKLTVIKDEAQNLSVIGKSAFQSCTSLKTFPHLLKEDNHITKIDNNAFGGCKSLTGAIKFGSELTSIGETAFGNSQIESLTIHSHNLTEIKMGSFTMCKNLKSVDISDTWVKKIYKDAFSLCLNLETVKLDKELEYIQEGAFYLAEKLTYVSNANHEGFFTSDFKDSFKWTNPVKVSGMLKGGYPIYKRLAYFQHHELIFDTTKTNKIKLKLDIDESKKSIRWEHPHFTEGVVDFDESTYEITVKEGLITTQQKLLKMIVEYADPFDESQTYTLEDTLNVVGTDNKAQTGVENVLSYNVRSPSTECEVSCAKPEVEGTVVHSWTIIIPDVYDSRYVTKIQDYAFAKINDKSASKLAHFSLPSVLKDFGHNLFDKSGDDLNPEDFKTRVGDSARIIFRGDNYYELGFPATSFCNFKSGPKLSVPEGVKSLEVNSFIKLEGLQEITIPNSLININPNFIVQCDQMARVNLPAYSKWTTLDGKYSFDVGTPEANWSKMKEHIDLGWKRVL